MSTARLITIEGSEGAGKTTAVNKICAVLDSWNINYICTREPGGETTAEKIREILLNSKHLHAKTELLLMFAARNEHIENIIKPALQQGTWVISDRYVDASYAYQGGGRSLGFDTIRWLDEFIVGKIQADLTILMDIDPKIGLERIKKRGQADRIEQEGLDFFDKIAKAYRKKAKLDEHRYAIIDASQSIDAVRQEIARVLTTHKDKLL
ncbi:MAG: dTMP kinase [Proteobacteria bacterium]|nr:dTMP kinase [Pseudomonadota bacterium]